MKKPYLLDVNVILALAWPSHVHHLSAQQWFAEKGFAKKGAAGFRTCPLTETGFVRISSNPAFTRDAVSPSAALELLERVKELPGYGFWPDHLPLLNSFENFSGIVGHRQVIDAYLLALAQAHKGILATLDRATVTLGRSKEGLVELLP